jgi:anti-sigma regulatory factor (Ser/Thr protein kinase)
VASFGFPLLNTAPRRARRHTVEFARRWGLDDLVDAAELLVSELMTNALEASEEGLRDDEGRPRFGVSALVAPLELRLVVEHRVEARRLRIEVRDHNPKLPPALVDDPELSSESGRGLMLIDAYADFWGYHRLPAGGKVVWCVVAPEAAPGADAP